MTDEQLPPEPGEVPDVDLGEPGDVEPYTGAGENLETEINDDEDEEDDNDSPS